jgi:hypothetical protein
MSEPGFHFVDVRVGVGYHQYFFLRRSRSGGNRHTDGNVYHFSYEFGQRFDGSLTSHYFVSLVIWDVECLL